MSSSPAVPFGPEELLKDGFNHLQQFLLPPASSSSAATTTAAGGTDAAASLADTAATHAKWSAACDMCVASGAVGPLVELILVRASDPDGRRGVDEEGDGNFLVKDEMFVTRWVRKSVEGCRADALALETQVVGSTPKDLETAVAPRFTALDIRCGHIFSILRALLVRVRWQVVLQAEFRLEFDPNLSDKAVLGSVAVDGSRTRICDVLTAARSLSYESLITSSVDAVVESNDAIQSLRTALLDRVSAIRSELVTIRQEGQRATDVYNQRRSLLDATRNVAAQQGQDTSDVEASSADLERQFETYNSIGRARQDILAKLLRYTEVELQLSSWMLAVRHLRRRISAGRWLVETFVHQQQHIPGRALVCDMRKFASSMSAVRDGVSEDSPLFWDGIWNRVKAGLAAASASDTSSSSSSSSSVDTVPESLLTLVDAGTAAVRSLVVDGERTVTAEDGVAASAAIANAFEAHNAALAAVLYSVVAQLVAPAHEGGGGGGGGASTIPAGTLRASVHDAVTGFSRALGSPLVAQSVLVVGLLDAAVRQLPAHSWLTDWAVDVVCTAPFSWSLPRDPTTTASDACPFGTNGAFGRRLLHLRRADILITSHRSLWASHSRLSPPAALVVVQALLECDRWVEAVSVARGVPGQQDRLLGECFRWFARGRWKQLLSLPLADTEEALLERELGALADSEPDLRTKDLRLVYRMHRLKPVDDLQTSSTKRRLDGDAESDAAMPSSGVSTRLKDVLAHYSARCAAPATATTPSGSKGPADDTAGTEAGLAKVPLVSSVPSSMASRLRQWQLRQLQVATGVGGGDGSGAGSGAGGGDDGGGGSDGGAGDEEMKADMDGVPFSGVPPSTPMTPRQPPSVMDMSFGPSTATPAGLSFGGAGSSFPVPSWAGDLSSFEHRTETKARRAPGTPVTASLGLPPGRHAAPNNANISAAFASIPGSASAAPPRPPVSFRSPVAPRRYYPSK